MDKINVIVKTTNACNLRCKYCYNSESGYTTEILPLDKLEKFLTMLAVDFREIVLVWHGGEPTYCGLDYFKKIVEMEDRIHAVNGVVIRNSLQTNGTLLNEEWIDFFKKYDFKVGLSFDGKDNDKYRQQGEKTLKAMQLMQKKGLNASCLAVVADDDYDLIENYEFFASKNIAVEFSYLFMEGGAKTMGSLTKEKYVEKYLKFVDHWFEDVDGVDVRLIESYIAMAMGNYFRICSNSSCHGKYLSIAPNGDIYNCGRDSMLLYPFGNVSSVNSYDEIIASDGFKNLLLGSIERRKKCKANCEFFDNCAGGCADCALSENGLTNPPEFACYCFQKIYTHVKAKMQKIKDEKIPLDKLNPGVRRTLKRCMTVSGGNFENLIADDFV